MSRVWIAVLKVLKVKVTVSVLDGMMEGLHVSVVCGFAIVTWYGIICLS